MPRQKYKCCGFYSLFVPDLNKYSNQCLRFPSSRQAVKDSWLLVYLSVSGKNISKVSGSEPVTLEIFFYQDRLFNRKPGSLTACLADRKFRHLLF